MANLPETATYDAGVTQLELATPVEGGPTGAANTPLKNLANRTTWLKQAVDALISGLAAAAGINSPTFTGTPAAPTPPLGDNTTKLATTAFVQGTVNGVLSKSVAGGSNVTLTAVEAGNGILVFTGLLTANIAVIVPAAGKSWIVSNQTTGAFTLTVKTASGTGIAVTQNRNSELYCDATNVLQSITDFVSPATTGTPTAPTAASGDNSSLIANTGFVFGATDGMSVVSVAGNVDVTLSQVQYGTAIVKITGALTGNINLIMPSQSGQWVIDNSTTGSFNVTAKTAAGTGAVLPQGFAVLVYGDGTNIFLASSSGQASFKKQEFTPTNGTTSLSVLGGFTPGNVLVEKNGAWLQSADFNQTTSPNIGLTVAANGTDLFGVYCFSSFAVADAILRSGDTMAGFLSLSANATAAMHAVPKQQLDSAIAGVFAHGQCQLSKSGANIVLLPKNGNRLVVNGISCSIPSAGVSLAPTGLTVSTVYNIYAVATAGVITSLEASATAHATDATTGVEIKTGDATRTLVAMVRPITGPAFADTAAQRFVLSYFNRRTLGGSASFTANRSQVSINAIAEVHTEIRNEFLCWGDDSIVAAFSGCMFNNTSPGGFFTTNTIGFDGTAVHSKGVSRNWAIDVSTVPFAISDTRVLAEGYHYATLASYSNATGNTITWNGNTIADDANTLQVQTRG